MVFLQIFDSEMVPFLSGTSYDVICKKCYEAKIQTLICGLHQKLMIIILKNKYTDFRCQKCYFMS